MRLAQSMLCLISLFTMCGCNTFKVPTNANESTKKLIKNANIAAPDLLAEVNNYYLNPRPTSSCVPFKNFETAPELAKNLLSGKEYKIRLVDFSDSGLSVTYYKENKELEFNLDILTKDGKCSGFIFTEVTICKF